MLYARTVWPLLLLSTGEILFTFKEVVSLHKSFFRPLDYAEMNHSSLSDWRKSAPNDQNNLIHYTKMYFKRDGRVEFYLRSPDHIVIERRLFQQEDRMNRPNQG